MHISHWLSHTGFTTHRSSPLPEPYPATLVLRRTGPSACGRPYKRARSACTVGNDAVSRDAGAPDPSRVRCGDHGTLRFWVVVPASLREMVVGMGEYSSRGAVPGYGVEDWLVP